MAKLLWKFTSYYGGMSGSALEVEGETLLEEADFRLVYITKKGLESSRWKEDIWRKVAEEAAKTYGIANGHIRMNNEGKRCLDIL